MRLSIVPIRQGVKRPEVIMFQEAAALAGYDVGKADGWAGKRTDAAIRKLQADARLTVDGVAGGATWAALLERVRGWRAPLLRRMHALIAWFETSNTRDAFGISEPDIGDGAGANYGVLQHNRHGSLVTVLTLGGRKDLVDLYNASNKSIPLAEVAEWMGSGEGIKAQCRYFDELVVGRYAAAEVSTLCGPEGPGRWFALGSPARERFELLAVDSMVQNGGLWSTKRRPFWKTLEPSEATDARNVELFEGKDWDRWIPWLSYAELKQRFLAAEARLGGVGPATLETLRAMLDETPTERGRLLLLAQWRSRSSAPAWWRPAVESRRMVDAAGRGKVNGAAIDLVADYGFDALEGDA